ncbi:MAG: hypothetical protein EAZ40_00690 [Rhodobacterales bacterium]|nr:MAG: hypothetical protein EAZ40_00690 [Rhodobacterales bacterium]
MKKFAAAATAGMFVFTASTAFAGGPVIVEDEIEVVAEKPASSASLLPLLLIPIILCVALCGGNDDETNLKPLNP